MVGQVSGRGETSLGTTLPAVGKSTLLFYSPSGRVEPKRGEGRPKGFRALTSRGPLSARSSRLSRRESEVSFHLVPNLRRGNEIKVN